MRDRYFTPQVTGLDLIAMFLKMGKLASSDLKRYESYCSIGLSSGDGHYKTYRELKFSLPSDMEIDIIWSMIKFARNNVAEAIIPVEEDLLGTCVMTPRIQRTLSFVDQHTTKAACKLAMNELGEEAHTAYLMDDLTHDESISSSQLEGAATTTRAAKEMLDSERKPRTMDEKMILGNTKMMHYVQQKRYKPLSLAMIRELHAEGVEGIDDTHYQPGEFRSASDVVVIEDGEGNIVHEPPQAGSLEARLHALIDWVTALHDDKTQYIHPLIKAITLHFMMGYIHPFKDGNGRVARALFYWFVLKSGYDTFAYLSISAVLKESAIGYGRSYVHTERDGMDLTYFVEYQCKAITQAIKKYQEAYHELLNGGEKFDLWLLRSGMYSKLSIRQRSIVLHARHHSKSVYTAKKVQHYLGCAANTAASALNALVDLGIFTKTKQGKQWLYRLKDIPTLVEGS